MFNGFLSGANDALGLRVSGDGFVLDDVSEAAMGALLRRRKKA